MDAALALFEQEAAHRIDQLEHAHGSQEALEAAHSLHGLAAIAGCATIEQRAAALERSLDENDAELPALFTTRVSALRTALEHLLAGGEAAVLFIDDDEGLRRLVARASASMRRNRALTSSRVWQEYDNSRTQGSD